MDARMVQADFFSIFTVCSLVTLSPFMRITLWASLVRFAGKRDMIQFGLCAFKSWACLSLQVVHI